MSIRLREIRKQRGWTRTRLCYLLKRQAAAAETALPNIDSLRRMVSRWENGDVIPGTLYRPLLAEVYGLTEVELGFEDKATRRSAQTGVEVSSGAAPHRLLRQADLLSISSRLHSPEADEALAVAGRSRLSLPTIEALESSITDIWKRDDQYGGEALRPAVTAQLRYVLSLLSGCRDESQRTRLHAVAAELARLTGWMLFDTRQFSTGYTYFEEALRLAREIEDTPFIANVLSSMSLQATYQDRPRDALTLVRAAQDVCRATATPRVSSMLAMREAFAQATLGHVSDCHAAIDNAERNLGRADGHDDPEWVAYFGEPKLVADTGIALSQLGESQLAEPLINKGLAWQDSSKVRTRAFHSYWLARTQLQSRSLDEACSTAGETLQLTSSVDSPRVMGHLRELHDRLGAYKNATVAEETRQLISQHSSIESLSPCNPVGYR